ncbi:MAG: tetratricopeptide repeat protein [Opitutaceae bacterium]
MAIERAEAKIFDPNDRAHRFKLWVRLGTSDGAFFHFYWRRLAIFLGVSAVTAWLLGAAAIWSLLRYQRGWEAAPYWQVAFMPVRMDSFRLSLGRFYAARGVAEIEGRNYLAGREFLLAGLRHARTDLTVRRTVATQLAQIFGLPQRAIDILADGLIHDPDLDYLVLTFGWMREARQLTRILELARRMLPAAPDGTLKHQFIALQEAMVHFDYGRFAEAEQVINAWGLQNSLEGQIVLARCEWERGKEDAALKRLEREISRFGKRDELYAELVRLNRRAGRYEPARRFALLRQFNDPRSAGPRLDLLQGYIDTNEQAAREREVTSYLGMFGGDQVAVLMLARFAAQIGDEALLERVMALAQEKGHRVEAVRMFQGLSAVLAGNYSRALEILLPPERPARPAPAPAAKGTPGAGANAAAANAATAAETPAPVVPRPPLWAGLRAAALFGAGQRLEGATELKQLMDRFPPLGWEGLLVAREVRRAGGAAAAVPLLRRICEIDALNEDSRAELVRLELEAGDRAALAAALEKVLTQARPPRALLEEVLLRLQPPGDDALIARLRTALEASAATP